MIVNVSCVSILTRPIPVAATECPKYKTWKTCIEKTCTDEQIIDLANKVRDCKMNQEINESAKKYTVDADGFLLGFGAGLGVLTVGMTAIKSYLFSK